MGKHSARRRPGRPRRPAFGDRRSPPRPGGPAPRAPAAASVRGPGRDGSARSTRRRGVTAGRCRAPQPHPEHREHARLGRGPDGWAGRRSDGRGGGPGPRELARDALGTEYPGTSRPPSTRGRSRAPDTARRPAPAPGAAAQGPADVPGPRQDFVDAFDAPRPPPRPAARPEPGARRRAASARGRARRRRRDAPETAQEERAGPVPLTGTAAAAVTTVLAVVVGGPGRRRR